MKKFLFICVALIAFLATNASGTNYQPTDQLQTFVVQQHNQIMPIVAVTLEPATAVYNFTCPANQTAYAYYSITETDGWRAPHWVPSLLVVCNANSNPFNDSYNILKRPILTLYSTRPNRTPDNYNVNFSYGLRN